MHYRKNYGEAYPALQPELTKKFRVILFIDGRIALHYLFAWGYIDNTLIVIGEI